jgi:kinetochore protein Spc7/SPC105
MVQLRAQFDVLAIRFPVNIECLPNETSSPAFKAAISALFPKFKAKALISFIFDFDTFSNWPMSIASVQCEVDVIYGTLK